MDLGLTGKNAIVMASSQGLGRAVAWLCSWAHSQFTGQALLIDGGLVKGL